MDNARIMMVATMVIGQFGLAVVEIAKGQYQTGAVAAMFAVCNVLIFWRTT